MPKKESKDVFSAEFIQKLEKLKYIFRKQFLSGTVGERAMRQKGGRIEFAGHRDYSHGDETRYVDWNVYGRLEKLFVKEFAREESIPVYILVDISKSMGVGGADSSGSKVDYARQMAVALGYIGLISGQPVQFTAFADDRFIRSDVFVSAKKLMEMIEFFRQVKVAGQTDLYNTFSSFDKSTPRKGFLIVLSDLFDGQGKDSRKILGQLSNRGFAISVMHISGEDTFNDGLCRFNDTETGEHKVIWVDKDVSVRYQQALKEFSREWSEFCLKHDIKYFHLNSMITIEDVILKMLRKGQLLR